MSSPGTVPTSKAVAGLLANFGSGVKRSLWRGNSFTQSAIVGKTPISDGGVQFMT